MNPWPFIIAAYGLTALALIGTSLWAWLSARRLEARAAQLSGRGE
ncbi:MULTISPECIES: heme exporter protein CcmD [Sphingobium]|uniref:Heme exporter protein D n=1 Tax=Sphingobium lignivorans TaxID=2735886 RepID=A0ABR6NEH1_9SPHN|nr:MULTISPECIES: heme exporter protein CcmD [Sphingobium]MBB5985680.1 hypothetical protein [Sphingobium lignivorans]